MCLGTFLLSVFILTWKHCQGVSYPIFYLFKPGSCERTLLLQGSFLRFVFIFQVLGMPMCACMCGSSVPMGLLFWGQSHTLWHWTFKDSFSMLECHIRFALGTRDRSNTEDKGVISRDWEGVGGDPRKVHCLNHKWGEGGQGTCL